MESYPTSSVDLERVMAVMDSIHQLQTKVQQHQSVEAVVRQVYADQDMPLDESILKQALRLNGASEQSLVKKTGTEPSEAHITLAVDVVTPVKNPQPIEDNPSDFGWIGRTIWLVVLISVFALGHAILSGPSAPSAPSEADINGFQQTMAMVTSATPITRANFDAISNIGLLGSEPATGDFTLSELNQNVCNMIVDRSEFSQTHNHALELVPRLELDHLSLATSPVSELRQQCQKTPKHTLTFERYNQNLKK